MQKVEINRALATKVLTVVDAGLSHGMGDRTPGRMCVEAAVCYAMGLPHSDDPPCVSRSVRAVKITINDRNWSSNEARAKGLRRVAIAQLGSVYVKELDAEFDREFNNAARALTKEHFVAKLASKLDQLRKLTADFSTVLVGGTPNKAHIWAMSATLSEYQQLLDRCSCTPLWSEAHGGDEFLAKLAEEAVQILIRLKSPGAEFLDLAPLQ